MNNNWKISIIFIFIIGILTACGNTSDESNADSNSSSTQNADVNATEDIDTTEATSEEANNTEQNDQGDTSNTAATNSNDEQSSNSSNSSNATESKQDEYFQKLNEMEEEDKNSEEVGTTTKEMEELEAERYQKWDAVLNEIYGVLEEQLSMDQMDELRIQQRSWLTYRDEAAKEASLQYEGGSMEALEYVATQASLTRERCYELVANYMQ